MRFFPLISVLLLTSFVGIGFNLAIAQNSNVTVSVTGTGASIDDAKTDAIRQALQLTMKQLVIVDRAVSGDKFLRDKVMSTMNGYVEGYQQKGVYRTPTGYKIDAEIAISSARIENFIGVVVGGKGEIDGAPLLAEQNRRLAQAAAEKAQAKARGEIFDRLFRGFPTAAMDIRVLSMNLSEKNVNLIRLEIELSYKKTFLQALEGTLKALARSECVPFDIAKHYLPANSLRDAARSRMYDTGCNGGEDIGILGPHPFSSATSYDAACIGLSSVVNCYLLAPGDYCLSCNLANFSHQQLMRGSLGINDSKMAVIFGRFIDAQGQVASKHNCLGNIPVLHFPIKTFIERYETSRGTNQMIAGFSFEKFHATIEIDSNLVDLSRAKYYVAVAGLSPQTSWDVNWSRNRWVTNLVPDMAQPVSGGCELLDEAVQRQLLTLR